MKAPLWTTRRFPSGKGIIREGYNQEVDELRQDMTGGKDYVAAIEKREREKPGFQSFGSAITGCSAITWR